MNAVVVSGASTGIGFAATQGLAQAGYTVFAGVRNDDDARRLAGLGANVKPVRLDVTDSASIAAARDEVLASGLPLRAVVSNAGVALAGPLETVPIDDLRRHFDVNVFGAVAFVQAFLPSLPTGGRVVFIGSISGRLAAPYIGPYSASKFALRAIADAMRVELAPADIAVTLIEPGSVKTPIWAKGREQRATMEAQLATSSRPHYRAALERLFEITKGEERDGMPVETVAKAIVAAVAAPRPRAAHIVGASAKMAGVIATLPTAFRARFMRARMKLP
ncbi:MAG: SDR family NAD(P)-dependent oxidoreductase [Candidatus Eremiobacteraeota bacterium]|nr:SDR family NAD(P)-dependent oxidoreductase [Candidatus Eremiobacteraeota bacterium]